MANPALKNGYISIATELVEKLARYHIPGNEMQVIWVVWRKTWGWTEGKRKKDWDEISYSQFEQMTGLHHRTIGRCLKSLVAKMLLLKENNRYKFNQNYDEWVVAKTLPVAKRVVRGSKSATKTGSGSATHNRYSKDTIQKISKSPSAILQGKQWNDLIDPFEKVNPMFRHFYKLKTERHALADMVKEMGFTKVKWLVDHLKEAVSKPYAPKITKPTELKRDLGKLIIFWEQEKQKNIKNGSKIGKI